jgi:hypothetical protein
MIFKRPTGGWCHPPFGRCDNHPWPEPGSYFQPDPGPDRRVTSKLSVSGLWLDQAQSRRPADRLGPVGCVQLLQNVADMRFDCAW